MNSVLIDLGFFKLKWYAFLLIIAFVLASMLITRESKKFKLNQDFIFNLIFWTVINGFIGARLYYIIFNWSYYSANLTEIVKVWNGGLAVHGGIIVGMLTIVFYSKKHNVKPIKMFDLMAPGLLLGQVVGRWGNFFNSEAHGAATTLETLQQYKIPNFIIEGMYIDGNYYHPTFLYESIWCFIGLIILLIIRKTKYIKVGHITAFYFVWYSVGRFIIESSRTDSLMFGGFKVAQIVSIVLFIIGVIWIYILSRKSKFEDLYNEIGIDTNIKF